MEKKLSKKQITELQELGVKFPEQILPSIVRQVGIQKTIEEIRKLLSPELVKTFENWISDLKKINAYLVKQKGKGICLWKGRKENLEKYSRLLL